LSCFPIKRSSVAYIIIAAPAENVICEQRAQGSRSEADVPAHRLCPTTCPERQADLNKRFVILPLEENSSGLIAVKITLLNLVPFQQRDSAICLT